MGHAILLIVAVVMSASYSALSAPPGYPKSEPVAPPPPTSKSPICSNVTKDIAPCVSYLTGDIDEPSQDCCVGVKSLGDMGSTKEVRQAICRCLKNQANLLQNLNTTRSTNLPSQCNVDVGQPTGPDTDCDKIDGPPAAGFSRFIVF